jgi:glyoxylase-like metal-dependent hydrolase (beta-lactamase superfamily II)
MKNSIKILHIFFMAVLLTPMFASSQVKHQQTHHNTHLVQAPGYYRIKVGDFQVTALSDGVVEGPIAQLIVDAKPGEVESALKANGESGPYMGNLNAFLINTGSQLILVDAGAGDIFAPGKLGKMTKNLVLAGYNPKDINVILLTHFHSDHCGGLVRKGKVIFPNAKIYLGKADIDLLFGASTPKPGADGKSPVQDEIDMLKPYRSAGKLKSIDGASELFPGISSVPAAGHTPGHNFFVLQSKGQKLVFWGDIVHFSEVQFPDPSITVIYDANRQAAKEQRLKVFNDAAKAGYLVASPHIAFPGFGHVTVENDVYKWIPLSYSTKQ